MGWGGAQIKCNILFMGGVVNKAKLNIEGDTFLISSYTSLLGRKGSVVFCANACRVVPLFWVMIQNLHASDLC